MGENNKSNKNIESNNKKQIEPIIGVYAIHNTKRDKYYIGSSNDVARRLKTHKRELSNGSHNNLKLQRDYTIDKSSNFKFKIIEKDISEELLTAYEKYYIYKYNAIVMYLGYNSIMPSTNHKTFKEIYNLKVEEENLLEMEKDII